MCYKHCLTPGTERLFTGVSAAWFLSSWLEDPTWVLSVWASIPYGQRTRGASCCCLLSRWDNADGVIFERRQAFTHWNPTPEPGPPGFWFSLKILTSSSSQCRNCYGTSLSRRWSSTRYSIASRLRMFPLLTCEIIPKKKELLCAMCRASIAFLFHYLIIFHPCHQYRKEGTLWCRTHLALSFLLFMTLSPCLRDFSPGLLLLQQLNNISC